MHRILLGWFLFIGTLAQGQSIESLYRQGKHAAIVRQAAVAKQLSGPEAYMVGRSYFQIGQDDLAVTYLDMALAKGLTTGPVYFQKGVALRFGKRYPEALQAFEAAIQAEPTNTEYQVEKGLVYYHAGQYEVALRYFEQLKAQPHPSPDALYMVPHLLHLQQQYPLALAGFYAAAAVIPPTHPRYLETLLDIGKLEYSFTGDYRKAAAAYTRALRLFPEEAQLPGKLMKAHNAAGQYSRADSVFKELQRLYKRNKLPQASKSGMVAVAELHWNKQTLTVHRNLNEPDKVLDVAYLVYLLTPDGKTVERKFTIERTLPLNNGPSYLLCEADRASGAHRTYPYGWKPTELSVGAIGEGVLLVLDGKMTPSASSNFGKE
ncbi:tetratricopeptide repeat protein [Hymenobacter tenuis]